MPKIIYEDNDIIVIDKPPGIAVQTKKVGEKDVVSELKNYLKGGYVGVVHRLDQPVGGLLVFAKNKQAAAGLSKQVSEKGEAGFVKDYTAVCFPGGIVPEQDTCEDYLIKEKEGVARVVDENEISGFPDAKKAVASYEKTGEMSIDDTLCPILSVHLKTGRFHQIRVQLAGRGLPIIGDMKYGSEESKELSKKAGVTRLYLTACHLEFRHPATGKKMTFDTGEE